MPDEFEDEPPTRPAHEALRQVAADALAYVSSVSDRPVAPSAVALAELAAFDEPLPESGAGVARTLRLLADVGGPATMASTGSRYFGFVTGATHPAALGSSWLTGAWDQNAALPVMSPVAAKLHGVVSEWLVDVLGLATATGVAFVSGATVANASCLAAARDALLTKQGWDVQADGLFGAPPFTVVVGAHAHSTLSKSLGLVGLGRSRVHVVPADDQGRMRADLLPDIEGPVLACAQAGEVNTGAFDPFDAIADWVAARDGWLHVDGAFGLWALADPSRAPLVAGPTAPIRGRPTVTSGSTPRTTAGSHLCDDPAISAARSRPRPAISRLTIASRRCITRRSRHNEPGRSRSGPFFAPSDGKGSPIWSAELVTWRSPSPIGCVQQVSRY